MPLSTFTAFSAITEGAPISPTYMNAKLSAITQNLTQLNTDAGNTGWDKGSITTLMTSTSRLSVNTIGVQSGTTLLIVPTTNVVSSSFMSGPQIFHVGAFNATGDGTTNDSSALQSAISAAKRIGGGIVQLGAGFFSINTTIRVLENVILQGAGRSGSTLTLASNLGTSFLLFDSGISDAGIRDLHIAGNARATALVHFQGASRCFAERVSASSAAAAGHCFYMSRGARQCTWRDCYGENGPGSSLMIYNDTATGLPNVDNLVENCIGTNSDNMGLEIRQSHRNRVFGGSYTSNRQAGINLEDGATDNIVIGAFLSNNTQGILFEGSSSVVSRNIIDACSVQSNNGVGIRLNNATDNILANCYVVRNSNGIELRFEAPASNFNRIVNCSTTSNSVHGIYFNGALGSVVGGEARSNGGVGILIDSVSSCLVVGVDARENTTRDIEELGAANGTAIVACQAGNISLLGNRTRRLAIPGVTDWSGTTLVLSEAAAGGALAGDAAGSPGEIAWGSSSGVSYLYVCVSANSWMRATLNPF